MSCIRIYTRSWFPFLALILSLSGTLNAAQASTVDPATAWTSASQAWAGQRRAEALELVAQHGMAAGRPWIAMALADADEAVVVAGLHALAGAGPATIADIDRARGMIPDLREPVAIAAMHAAARIEDDAALPVLIDVAQQLGARRDAAVAAIRRLAPNDRPDEPEQWPAWFIGNRAAARAALAQIEIDVASTDRHRIEAALSTVATWRTQRGLVIDRLEPLLDHHDAELSRAAHTALTQLGGPRVAVMLRARELMATTAVPSVASSLWNWVLPIGALMIFLLVFWSFGTRSGSQVRKATMRLVRTGTQRVPSAQVARAVRDATRRMTRTAPPTTDLASQVRGTSIPASDGSAGGSGR